jgi:hypothetical protein
VESLERSIAELEERLKQEVAPSGGNILTNVACTALFPEEKYFPVGSDHKDQYIALLAEYEIVCKERETIKRDKDIANNEIRKLGAELVETKTTHKQTEDQHKNQVEELKRQLEINSLLMISDQSIQFLIFIFNSIICGMRFVFITLSLFTRLYHIFT